MEIICVVPKNEDGFQFTPENILENIDKLGPWSAYSLAEQAIEYYHPSVKRIKDPLKLIERQVHFCNKAGNFTWHDWVIKYQKEVGYKVNGGWNKDAINEY